MVEKIDTVKVKIIEKEQLNILLLPNNLLKKIDHWNHQKLKKGILIVDKDKILHLNIKERNPKLKEHYMELNHSTT